eukprot:g81232.t1
MSEVSNEHLNQLTAVLPSTSRPEIWSQSSSTMRRGNGANPEYLPRVSSHVGIDNIRAQELLRMGQGFTRWKLKRKMLGGTDEALPCRVNVDDQLRNINISYVRNNRIDRILASRVTGVCMMAYKEDVKQRLQLSDSLFFTLIYMKKNSSKVKTLFFQCENAKMASTWVVALKWLLETTTLVRQGKHAQPLQQPTIDAAKKKEILKEGEVFLMHRPTYNRPCEVRLKCSGNLAHIVWGAKTTGKDKWNHLPTQELHQVLVGEQSPMFGLAKWCFTLRFQTKDVHLSAADAAVLRQWTALLLWLHETHSGITMPVSVTKGARLTTDLNWEGLQIKLGKKLGAGGFCEVYEATHAGGHKMAMKVFDFDAEIHREIDTLKKLKHDTIVSYYGCTKDEQKGKMYLLLEFCDGGSLDDLLKRAKEPLKEVHIAFILRSVLEALQYLHSQGVIHRDIKAANILLTLSGKVKLTDFGISAKITMDGEEYKGTIAGSPLFMSPEDLRGSPPTPRSDTWALGITALQLAYRKPPHCELREFLDIFKAVSKSDAPTLESARPPGDTRGKFSEEFADFISKCLVKDVEQRAGIEELLAHPWMDLPKVGSEYWLLLCDQLESFIQHNGVYTYAQNLLKEESVSALREFIRKKENKEDMPENLKTKYNYVRSLLPLIEARVQPMEASNASKDSGAAAATPSLEKVEGGTTIQKNKEEVIDFYAFLDEVEAKKQSAATATSSEKDGAAAASEKEEGVDFYDFLDEMGAEKQSQDLKQKLKDDGKVPTLQRQARGLEREPKKSGERKVKWALPHFPRISSIENTTVKSQKSSTKDGKPRRGSIFKPQAFRSAFNLAVVQRGASFTMRQVRQDMANWVAEQTEEGDDAATGFEPSVTNDNYEPSVSRDETSITRDDSDEEDDAKRAKPSTAASKSPRLVASMFNVGGRKGKDITSPDSVSSSASPLHIVTTPPEQTRELSGEAAQSSRGKSRLQVESPNSTRSKKESPKSQSSCGRRLGGDALADSPKSTGSGRRLGGDALGESPPKSQGRRLGGDALGESSPKSQGRRLGGDALGESSPKSQGGRRRLGGDALILRNESDEEDIDSDDEEEQPVSRSRLKFQNEEDAMKTYKFEGEAFVLNAKKGNIKLTETGISVHDKLAMMLQKEDLRIMQAIGRGQHGTVYKALHVPSLECVAMKTMNALAQDARHQMVRELEAYSSLNSKQIVNFLGAYFDQGKMIIASELMENGSMDGFMQRKSPKGMPEPIVRHVAWQAVKGLEYLHSNRMVHRDIKPDNILLNAKGEAKLGDFGLLTETAVQGTNNLETFVGTMRYLSPERLENNTYGPPSDIWAMGLTIMYMCTGQEVNQSTDFWEVKMGLEKNTLGLDKEKFSPELCDFVDKLLIKDPRTRWKASQLLNHPFLKPLTDKKKVEEQAAQAGTATSTTDTSAADKGGEAGGQAKSVLATDKEIEDFFWLDRSKDIDMVVDILLEGIYDLTKADVWQRLSVSFRKPVPEIFEAFMRAMSKVQQEASSQGLEGTVQAQEAEQQTN